MEAAVMMMIGSSSSSLVPSYNNNNNMCNFNFKFKSHPLVHHSFNHHRNNNNKVVLAFDFKLSISSSSTQAQGLLLSSSSHAHAQAEVDDHELLIQESPNGYAFEAETQTVRVQFRLQRECSFGQNFLITGDHPILGSWDPNNAISLTWSDGHIWTADIDIPVGECIKFKLVMQESDGKFVWQPGPDRVLEGCFQTEKIITLCEDWENPDARIILETDPTTNQEIQIVEPSQEPEEYAICLEEELVSDEVVPVLVPGLSQLSVDEGLEDEHEPVNGAAVVAAGPDMTQDLTLPELESKDDIANASDLNPRPEISSVNENQESCDIKHQEMQVTEEQDHEATQPMRSLLHNDIQWSNNVMQKLLNIFGI
ncbi:uncharacterized protein LOC143608394 [Bidens hawaiensis]|uniref:uncharacterized protein LOC143608394 n=1 Tax=Bidens hawaiensis TaxID=980011 RepID=UPI00404A6C8A